MAFIIPIAAAIWSAVAAAASAIVTAISAVVSFVSGIVSGIGAWLSTALAAIVGVEAAATIISIGTTLYEIASIAYSVYSVISAFSQGNTSAGIAGVVGVIGAIYTIAEGTLGPFVDKIVTSFKEFTGAINLELALKINNIVYLVSDDYRKTMDRVYVQIGGVSKALGNSAEFMMLLLRDAKAVVQSTAAVMGRKYDLGELVWLKTLEDYFKVVQTQATKYVNNPGELIQDIDTHFFKPTVDTQAAVYQNLYGIVETVLATTKQSIEEVTKIRAAVDHVVKGLPAEVTKYITPYTQDIFRKYDGWIENVYTPANKALELSFARYDTDILRLGLELKEVVLYIINPADYLERIKSLSAADQARVVSIIGQVVTGKYSEDLQQWMASYTPGQARMFDIVRRLEREYQRPEWDPMGLETPERIEGEAPEPRDTWDVGDY